MTLIAPIVALLCAFSIAAQPEPVAWCGLAVRVLDQAKTPVPAIVRHVELGVQAATDAKGWTTWNTGQRENVWRQGRPFTVQVVADGYLPVERRFTTPRPAKNTCCEMPLFSFEIRLVPIAFVPPVTRPAEVVPADGYYTYEYQGYTEKACCQGPTVICVDYVQGKATAQIDYTDKNRKTDKTSAKASWAFGDAKKDLLSFGFVIEGESSAEKSLEIDAKLGADLPPDQCGSVCIRKVLTTLMWEKTYHVAGRAYPAGKVTLDIVTGTCVTAAALHRCDVMGEIDACGQPRKTH